MSRRRARWILKPLGDGGLGKVVDREDPHRHLVVGEAVPAVRDGRGLVERRARREDHERDRADAVGARHGDGLATGDSGQLLQVGLDLQRVHEKAREPQHVSHAAEEGEAAIPIELREISGPDIAVGGHGLRRRRVVSVVAGHQRRAGALERAGLADAQQFAGLRVPDADVPKGGGRNAAPLLAVRHLGIDGLQRIERLHLAHSIESAEPEAAPLRAFRNVVERGIEGGVAGPLHRRESVVAGHGIEQAGRYMSSLPNNVVGRYCAISRAISSIS